VWLATAREAGLRGVSGVVLQDLARSGRIGLSAVFAYVGQLRPRTGVIGPDGGVPRSAGLPGGGLAPTRPLREELLWRHRATVLPRHVGHSVSAGGVISGRLHGPLTWTAFITRQTEVPAASTWVHPPAGLCPRHRKSSLRARLERFRGEVMATGGASPASDTCNRSNGHLTTPRCLTRAQPLHVTPYIRDGNARPQMGHAS